MSPQKEGKVILEEATHKLNHAFVSFAVLSVAPQPAGVVLCNHVRSCVKFYSSFFKRATSVKVVQEGIELEGLRHVFSPAFLSGKSQAHACCHRGRRYSACSQYVHTNGSVYNNPDRGCEQ